MRPRPLDDDETPDEEMLIGGNVDRVVGSLRVMGDDLNPGDVSKLLGVEPTTAAKKGEVRPGTLRQVPQRTGVWILDPGFNSREWILEDLISTLLDRVPAPVEAWQQLAGRYKVDVFCGLFLERWNRGADLSPKLLKRLAERGIGLSLDIYCDDDLDA